MRIEPFRPPGCGGRRPEELCELLDEYEVPFGQQEALLAIARCAREDGWWLEYRDVLPPAAQDYLVMETAAAEIVSYEVSQVPDLLQTPGYMRAVAAADARCTSDEQRAHAVEAKVNRQRIVFNDRAPGLDLVITEGALRQTVGRPRVMRDPLVRLADLADTGVADGPTGGRAGVCRLFRPWGEFSGFRCMPSPQA